MLALRADGAETVVVGVLPIPGVGPFLGSAPFFVIPSHEESTMPATTKKTPTKKPARTINLASKDLEPFVVPIRSLKPDPSNTNTHNARNLETIQRALQSHGQHRLAVVRRKTGVVVVGNGMLEAAKSLGWTHLAVVKVDDDDKTARTRSIMDNRASELATWDEEKLLAELEAISTEGLLPDTGFVSAELDELTKRLGDEVIAKEKKEPQGKNVDPDTGEQRPNPPKEPVPDVEISNDVEMPKEPVARPGDLFTLGAHRLIVGDSTDPDTITRLLGKKVAACVFTDPPFAIYGSSTGVDQSVSDDGMVRPFFRQTMKAIAAVLKPFGHAYVCCDWRSYPAIREESRGLLEAKNLIIWWKTNAGGPSGSNYFNHHELMGFFVKQPKSKRLMSKSETGARNIFESNVWAEATVDSRHRHHFAEKPPKNVARALRNSSDEGDVVVDLFGGSGTTLLVSEELGRSCFMVEKEPGMADVIVKRWQEQAKRKATAVDSNGKKVTRTVR